MTHEQIRATREQQHEVGARFLCATALAYLVHGLSVDVIHVDEDGLGETSGAVRVIDAADSGRISLVGDAVQLEWLTASMGQDAAIKRTLDIWEQAAVTAFHDEDDDNDSGVLKGRSIFVSAPWAIAFVAANRALITELAALLRASDGHLEPAAFLPVVEGRITSVTSEASNAAYEMLEPYEAQLKEIQSVLSAWRKLQN